MASCIKLTLNPLYFSLIARGVKKVEGRTFKASLHGLKTGHLIYFHNKEQLQPPIRAQVTSLKKYASFHEMLNIEGLQNVLPGVEHIEEGVKIYHSFPHYQEEEKSLGVLAIHFKLEP
ncbi:MAG: ASCH domain-containing protein [Rhabdochlamydiaceae bacterium]